MYYKNYRTHWSHPQHALVRCKYSDRSGYVCYLCNFGLSGLIGFRCEACDFDIHEECADFKETIDGASFARRHVFTFSRVVGTEDDFCLVCRMDCPRERFYRCAPCNFNVCINCARHVFHPPWSGLELDNISGGGGGKKTVRRRLVCWARRVAGARRDAERLAGVLSKIDFYLSLYPAIAHADTACRQDRLLWTTTVNVVVSAAVAFAGFVVVSISMVSRKK
uniref:Phorbol-ester/DAG-type domain-containing protein n=1 Tax=Oryza barthii TaxID=65489 RepID=A0A0D3HPS2_9ORYZ